MQGAIDGVGLKHAHAGTFLKQASFFAADHEVAAIPAVHRQARIGALAMIAPRPSAGFSPAVQAALSPSLGRTCSGLALQAGFGHGFMKNSYFNFDVKKVKKVKIHTDVSSAGTGIGTFRVDPWLIGVGIGRRF
jgi:hypothetical protein